MEFKIVPHAKFSPTRCALCGDHEGPFVDTEVEWPAFGHVYLCLGHGRRSGCVAQMARLAGMTDGSEFEELRDTLAVAEITIASLREELGQQPRLMTAADADRLLRKAIKTANATRSE